jgi:hypothetical protein
MSRSPVTFVRWFPIVAVVSGVVAAQARLADPPRLPPVRAVRACVDAETGALYAMGGREDRVLDVWRRQAGDWQRVAAGPFSGTVTSLAFDTVRDVLVALVTNDAGVRSMQELSGTTWTTAAVTPANGSTLLWHPALAQLLVWSPAVFTLPPTTTGPTLSTWDGTTRLMVPMAGLSLFASPGDRIGYDAARNRVVVPQAAYSVGLPWVHEWDGTTWTTVVSTGGSSGGGTVFTDPVSGRVVFASLDSGATSAWTGQAFVPWSLAGAPQRNLATIVGNAPRQVCQLVGGSFGGLHGDTWELDGSGWQQVTPETADPQAWTPALAAVGDGRALRFDGGFGGPGATASTAVWDHGTWTVLQPASSPSPRSRFALAGDPATGRAWLFGGVANGGAPLGDFWQWNGTGWQQLPGGPGARCDLGLCFRADTQTLVLYGGNDGAGSANHETWEWNGTAWSLRSATFPPHTGEARLAWVPGRQRVVLTTFGLLGLEVWEWDGVSWFSTNPPVRPSPQQGLHVAYDPVRENVLLVEATAAFGTPLPAPGAIHEWDGSQWRPLPNDPRLRGTTLAVAGVPGVGLLVANGTTRITQTLVHDAPAVVAPFGSACPDPQRLLTATAPWLGRTVTLRWPCAAGELCVFASGFGNTQWNGVPLPFDLGVLGLPGCSLRVAADVLDLRAPSGGVASLAIALPATPSLAGTRLYHQAAALGTSFTAVSQGLELVAGALW